MSFLLMNNEMTSNGYLAAIEFYVADEGQLSMEMLCFKDLGYPDLLSYYENTKNPILASISTFVIVNDSFPVGYNIYNLPKPTFYVKNCIIRLKQFEGKISITSERTQNGEKRFSDYNLDQRVFLHELIDPAASSMRFNVRMIMKNDNNSQISSSERYQLFQLSYPTPGIKFLKIKAFSQGLKTAELNKSINVQNYIYADGDEGDSF